MVIFYYPQNTPPKLGRMPLSVLALAAMMEGKSEYAIVDGNVDRDALKTLRRLLRSNPAGDVLAVSVMPGLQMLNAIRHCKKLKQEFPHVTVVWGGYFPTMHTESVLNSDYVDYVVRGQGEIPLLQLLEMSVNSSSSRETHNLSYRTAGGFHHDPELPVFDPNDRPVFPYHRIAVDKYAIPTFIGKRTLSHETSVGCPHKCNFCGVVDLFHSRWKAETPERTYETVKLLRDRYGMDGVEFHDSEFFVSEKRVVALCEKLADLGLSWWSEGRIDRLLSFERETWKLLRRSGLRMIFFGAESGLDATLQLMDKGGVTVEKTKAVAAMCREFDIQSEFSFVMGANPVRTEEDIDATIHLMYELERINPKSQMHPFVYTPVPIGTIYNKAVEGGLRYPSTLDEWAKREWLQYTLRRNPHTPWLTRRLHRRIVNFRAVHQSYYPKTNDRIIPGWRLRILKFFSSWRYRLRFFAGAYEIRLLLRFLGARSPMREGF